MHSRRPCKNLWRYLRMLGNKAEYSELDDYLGDFPDIRRIRQLANLLNCADTELQGMSESPNDGTRRIARLILALSKASESAFFQKGISDKYAVIRSDTARFAGVGTDRTRLYNQLVRLIREDPDIRVRKAAGRRLRKTFADLYSVDHDSIPPFPRMLLLDSLGGYARIDEELVKPLLFSENPEMAFRAARKLLKWGTLRRYFESKSGEELLMRAAELGVVDFLEHAKINTADKDLARRLAGRANRSDLISLLSESPTSLQNEKFTQESEKIQQLVQELAKCSSDDKDVVIAAVNKFPTQDIKHTIESFYPTLSSENCAEILIEIARRGHWVDWQNRISKAAESESPDIRREAILALSELKGESAAAEISPFLLDNIERVRIAASQALTLLPSSCGFIHLVRYLTIEPEGEIRRSIIEGIRKVGSVSTLNCLIENPGIIPPDLIGEIFNQGIDEPGVKLLAQKGSNVIDEVVRFGGFHTGKSIFLAWEKLESEEKDRLLRWIAKTHWVHSVIAMLKKKSAELGNKPILNHLGREEILKLFEEILRDETPKNRRQLKRRLLRKLR